MKRSTAAIDTISSFLLKNEMTVYIVIFDRKAYQLIGKLFADAHEGWLCALPFQ